MTGRAKVHNENGGKDGGEENVSHSGNVKHWQNEDERGRFAERGNDDEAGALRQTRVPIIKLYYTFVVKAF
jgi:hypothetical protein